jgi:RimJ/RimL family protein N-acetyltransferase
MALQILVREAQPSDAAAVITAIRSVMAEPDNDLNTNVEEFNSTEKNEMGFITSMTQDENTLMLVSENFVHGEIVGVLTCVADSRMSRRHNARLGLLVTGPWRGRGVGKHMMNEAIGWAQRHPFIRRLELEVLVRNTRAITLYQSLGFTVEGTARGVVLKRGFYLDSYYMALQLEGRPLLTRQPLVLGLSTPATLPSPTDAPLPPENTNQRGE